MSQEFNFPTETIELPSKGLIYADSNPLSSGKVDMKYMTAREEDILTNTNFIEQGIVIDKLLQSLIVSEINYDDLIIGDKNALLVAARILGYGKDYSFNYLGEDVIVDLTTLNHKVIDESNFNKENRFSFTLPTSNTILEFKILTHGDETLIEKELRGLEKVSKEANFSSTTRLKYSILSVNGDSDKKVINDFVENHFLAMDSRAFRNHLKAIQPDIDLKFYPENGPTGGVDIPIGISFFWPDA